ncbi:MULTISPECIES: hypothetical protein [Ruminococcus]|nr:MULTISPECIES: hypothetical protein [Ruminococcus]
MAFCYTSLNYAGGIIVRILQIIGANTGSFTPDSCNAQLPY